MGKLVIYNFVTLNGYFKGPKGDLSWKEHGDPEEGQYAAESLKGNSILLFGRVTYEMMVSYWPTPEAIKNDKKVAEGMNKAEKIVFSKTLKKAEWNNTRVVSDNMVEEINKLKKQSPKSMTVLGSGTIITQLADEGLIDEYQVLLSPVAIGDGTPLLNGIHQQLNLKLKSTKAFKNGAVMLTYEPKK